MGKYDMASRVYGSRCPTPDCPSHDQLRPDFSPVFRADGLYVDCGACGRTFKA